MKIKFQKNFKVFNFCLVVFIFCQLFNISQVSAQNNEFNLGQARDLVVSEGFFYDNGGKYSNITNKYSITTFHAKKDLIEIYFTNYTIPQGSEIRIYNGNTNKDPLFGVFGFGDKIWNVSGPNITIEYIPSSFDKAPASGWNGVIRTIPFSDKKTKSLMPESDCPGAIPLCQNTTVIALGGLYTDLGSISDDDGSCYSGTGSGGSVWYTFTPQSNGPLDFTITPTGSTDYDFVVWDITNGCASGQRVQVSCNFSLYTGATGLSSINCSESIGGGGNCTSNDCSTDSKQSDCNRFNRRLNVLTTHQYAICVNFYSGSNDGFVLTFKNEASSVNITDVTPPFINNTYANVCGGASQLHIHFNEWVDCATIQNGDFTLAGYTFTVTNNYCINGRTDQVDLSVSPALPLGTYSIHAQDILDFCGNNMNSNYSVVIGSVPTANAGSDKITCKSPGFLGIGWTYSPSSQTLTATSGTSYEWSDGQTGASVGVSPTTTTTYTVTVANGACTATDNVVVFVDVAPSPNLGADQTICAGFPVTFNASGGVSYQWQSTTTTIFGTPTGWTNIPGATSSTYTGTPGSTIYYQVLVTSANGCTGSDWVKVTIGSGVFNAIASPPIICAGSSTTLSMPPSLPSYTWTGGPTNTSWVVSPATSTVYTVTSNTVGCTGTSTITITVNSLPVVTATASNLTPCLGDVVSLSSTPSGSSSSVSETFEGATQTLTLINGANNKWYHGNAAFCNGVKGLYIGTAAGNNNYTNFNLIFGIAAVNFAYQDVAISGYCQSDLSFNWKCLGNATDNLTVWAIPTTTTPAAGTALVAGGGNVLIGGPYWNSSAACNPVTISLLPFIGTSQRIVFQWQNTAGLFSNTAASPAASIDDIAITQNTSYSYSWTSVPAGFTSTSQSPSVSPTVNTTYNLTTTRCDGCSNTASATVTMCAASPIPVANFSSSDTTICVGSCINFTDLSSNTPTSWAWTFAGAATPTSTQQNPVGICYNTAGSYNVTLVATNANGSGTIVKNLFINVINNPTIVVSPNATSICNGSSDTLVASGANTYTWLPATALNTTIGNTVIANPTSTTTYTVTGTSSGCSNIATVQVTVNNPPTLAMSSISASCGMSNGSATVNPTGGNTPYSYSWSTSPVQNTATAANIPAGSYTVTVNDANFCSTTGTVNVSNSSGPTLTSSSVNATCGMSNGSATVTPTGGTLPYSYSWNTSPIQTTAIASNIPSGSYTVTVSDGSSCSAITTVVVGGTSGPSLSSSFTDATCGLSDGSATAIPSGGTLPYSYNWNTSPVQTTVTALNIPAGTYTVTVSDGNSCTATTTVTINNIGGPTVSISGNNSTCGLANGDATVNPIGGTSPYTYLWNTSPAQSTQTASNLPAGTYSVTVTDAGSCNATTTIVITTSPNPIATAGTIIPSECGQSNGSATIIASSGMGPYTYSWNTVPPQSTATITNVPTGTYIVTITDANSCSQTQTVSIGSTGGPTATITPNIVTIHSGDIVSLTASGGVNYSWTPSVGLSCNNCPNPVASPTVSTVYCVLVSDANNCSDTACASVLLEILCGEVFIPSAFSPNNDNSNDVLYIRGNCITTMEFAIFDRWGEKVFETTDVVNGWDGKYKGQLMNSQVFVYYLTATLLNGEQIKRQGNISLVR